MLNSQRLSLPIPERMASPPPLLAASGSLTARCGGRDSPLYSFYQQLVHCPLEDPNARLAAVNGFFSALNGSGVPAMSSSNALNTSGRHSVNRERAASHPEPSPRPHLSEAEEQSRRMLKSFGVWVPIALAAVTDSWSMVRKKAATEASIALASYIEQATGAFVPLPAIMISSSSSNFGVGATSSRSERSSASKRAPSAATRKVVSPRTGSPKGSPTAPPSAAVSSLFPIHELVLRATKGRSLWYVQEGVLLLLDKCLQQPMIKEFFGNNYDATAWHLLQGISLKLVAHAQLPVRLLACKVSGALCVSPTAPSHRTEELHQLLLGVAVAQIKGGMQSSSLLANGTNMVNMSPASQSQSSFSASQGAPCPHSPAPTTTLEQQRSLSMIEGGISLLLAMDPLWTRTLLGQYTSLISSLAYHGAASIRFEVADLLSRLPLTDLEATWQTRLLSVSTSPRSPITAQLEPSWTSKETFLIALVATLKRLGVAKITNVEAACARAILLSLRSALDSSKEFEVQRIGSQAIPLLAQCWASKGTPSTSSDGSAPNTPGAMASLSFATCSVLFSEDDLAYLRERKDMARWICWFAVIRRVLAVHGRHLQQQGQRPQYPTAREETSLGTTPEGLSQMASSVMFSEPFPTPLRHQSLARLPAPVLYEVPPSELSTSAEWVTSIVVAASGAAGAQSRNNTNTSFGNAVVAAVGSQPRQLLSAWERVVMSSYDLSMGNTSAASSPSTSPATTPSYRPVSPSTSQFNVSEVIATPADWTEALLDDENVAKHALAFAKKFVVADEARLEQVVNEAWLPSIRDRHTHTHVQCLLLDSIRIAVSRNVAISSRCPHPFLFLTHSSYQAPEIEDGGSAGYDGREWIQSFVGPTHWLESTVEATTPERRRSVASLIALTHLGLNAETHKAIFTVVEGLFMDKGTEPSVLHSAELLLLAMERALPDPTQAVLLGLRRLRLLFPNYESLLRGSSTQPEYKDEESDWDASSSSSEDWDKESSSDGGEQSLLVAGISAIDEVARVRRLLKIFDTQLQRGALSSVDAASADVLSLFSPPDAESLRLIQSADNVG